MHFIPACLPEIDPNIEIGAINIGKQGKFTGRLWSSAVKAENIVEALKKFVEVMRIEQCHIKIEDGFDDNPIGGFKDI